MVQNLELNRIIRRLENGGTPSLQGVTNLTHKKALRAVINGNRPTNRTDDPSLNKAIRQILNRR